MNWIGPTMILILATGLGRVIEKLKQKTKCPFIVIFSSYHIRRNKSHVETLYEKNAAFAAQSYGNDHMLAVGFKQIQMRYY